MTIRRLFAGLAYACLFFFSTQSHTAVVLGADTSWLSEMEANGNLFYNSSGTQQDLFPILKQHGMSAVRLRVWVNPQDGYNGMADTLANQTGLPPFIQYIQVKNQGSCIQVASPNRRPLSAEPGSRRRRGSR